MGKYGFMLRVAFNRLLGGLSNIVALECHLSSDTELPLCYAKGAVQEAQDLIRAHHQAMQDGLTPWTQRVKKPTGDCKPFRPRHTSVPGASPGTSGSSRLNKPIKHSIISTSMCTPFLRSPLAPKPGSTSSKSWMRQDWKAAWGESHNGRPSARRDRTKTGNPLLRVSEGPDHWV